MVPAASSPPTIAPDVTAMSRPPSHSSGVLRRIRPSPTPTTISGQARHQPVTWSAVSPPPRTGAGPPRRGRRTGPSRRMTGRSATPHPPRPTTGVPPIPESSRDPRMLASPARPHRTRHGPGGIAVRLSDWRAAAPRKDSMAPKVTGTIEAALSMLGRRRRPGVLGGVGRRSGHPLLDLRAKRPRAWPRSTSGSTSPARARGPRASSSAGTASSSASSRSRSRAATGWSTSRSRATSFAAPTTDADVVAEFVMTLYDAVDGRTAPPPAASAAGPAQAKAKRRGKPVPLLPPPKGAER